MINFVFFRDGVSCVENSVSICSILKKRSTGAIIQNYFRHYCEIILIVVQKVFELKAVFVRNFQVFFVRKPNRDPPTLSWILLRIEIVFMKYIIVLVCSLSSHLSSQNKIQYTHTPTLIYRFYL
jgi:hypothetical protein